MKTYLIFLLSLFTASATAQACDAPKLARDAVRAIALVSDRAMITELIGGATQGGINIWANYGHHGYSDQYIVVIDSCRVVELKLVAKDLPIQVP